jgi:type II secretory pathway pseudopilin PulG
MRSKAFTLVEALIAVAILIVGVVSVLAAMSALSRTEARALESERMHRLAISKYEELLATGELVGGTLSGDFADWNEDRYTWSADTMPTGIENLESVRVTVQHRQRANAPVAEIDGLYYRPPLVVAGGLP